MVNENEVITIKLDDIIPNRFQPREMFDEQSMQELAESIKTHGVIQPIIVRPVDNKYEIIAGERRYKASVMAGKTDIPAIVKNKDDKESSIIAFIENSQRKDVSPIEEARTCERILSTNDITQEQLAKQLGMSQSTLANKLRLLTLPIEVQDALLHGEISERHARSLISIKDTRKQLDLLDKVKNEKLTVRELDGVIKNMLEEANKDGLYNLPGSDEYNDNLEKTNPIDFSKYEIKNEEVPAMPIEEKQESTEGTNEFLTFLNTIDEDKLKEPVAEETKTEEVPVVEEPKVEPATNEFLSFLNTIDESKFAQPEEKPSEEEPAFVNTEEVPAVEEPKAEPATNEFLSFLNTIDSSKFASTEVPATPAPPEVSESAIPVEPAVEDKSFDDFLSNFNSGIEPSTPEVPEQKEETPVEAPKEENNDFISFLNTFDESKFAPPEIPEVSSDEGTEGGMTNVNTQATTEEISKGIDEFLKKYEEPVSTPVDLGPVEEMVKEETPVNVPSTQEETSVEAPVDPNSKYLNPIEEVAPKTEYVENSPNYVDITKPISYDSVDSIIGELKVVTDKIKKSKYKITTEETNYDDVYTITIKIDKRNFL